MANITLPSNPVNGQTVVIGTRLFQYDSTANRWKSRVFQVLGDTSVTVTNEAPTITASLSEIALDTSGANVSFTYTVSDVDSSILKVSHSVSGIANSDLATVTHHKANNTVTITAGTEEFANGQITLTVTDGRNNATDTVDVSALYSWIVDVTNITYDSVSFSTSSQSTGPNGLRFNNDGTKMYIMDRNSTTIYQYSLSTAYDISTTSYDSVSFDTSSQESSPASVTFNNDGSKMYVCGFGGNKVYQYSLSTAYDISTTSYDNVSFTLSHSYGMDIKFNNNGTKMYVMGFNLDELHQYSLSTAYDISTASYDTGVEFSPFTNGDNLDTNPTSVSFNPDGSKMYLAAAQSRRILEFSLSTEFDISTLSYDSRVFSTSSTALTPNDIVFKPDGTKMYLVCVIEDKVFQYSTGL